MLRWFKRIVISLLFLFLVLFAFIRFQGLQYIAAYLGSGFARNLPDLNSFPKQPSCNTPPIKVLSYNVRYGSTTIEAMATRFRNGDTGDSFLPWSVRLPEIRERIASYTPDLMGLQEMETDKDINAIVSRDQYTLVSYHLGNFEYGDSALLYKTARFEQLDSGQLWLGPNPELPMSLGFKRLAMIRYSNWVLLRDKSTGFIFMYVNTHFDNASKNKDPSSILFRERITGLVAGVPMIVSGDFNTTASTERYYRFTGSNEHPSLLQNTYDSFKNKSQGDITAHPDNLIDHILVGGPCNVDADQWVVDSLPLKNGQAMSDHYPVFVQVNFSSKPIDREALQ
ncbi:MAG: endonuclease/exonuclease/phosphatase family protein [Methylobacter sp.]|nr:endonuclease/exonuclease/phosphatase family protein [Methylobacter sp.]